MLSLISFFSQVHEGAALSLWFSGTQVTVTVVIFLLSVKLGHGRYFSKVNKKLYAIAAIGLVTWFLSDSSIYALGISIGISLLGGSRTVIKAYRYPGTETISAWMMALVASIFGVASVGQLNMVLLAYPLYLVAIYTAITFALLVGRLAQTRTIKKQEMQHITFSRKSIRSNTPTLSPNPELEQ